MSKKKCQQETNKCCYNNHFNNPQEDDIPLQTLPQARRERASHVSVLETRSVNNNTPIPRNPNRENESNLLLVTEDFLDIEFMERQSQTPSTTQTKTVQTSNFHVMPLIYLPDKQLAAHEENQGVLSGVENPGGQGKQRPVVETNKKPSVESGHKQAPGDPSVFKPMEKLSRHTQVPDDYYDPPTPAEQAPVPQKTEKNSISNKNGLPFPGDAYALSSIRPMEKPSRHTQAPDDYYDPPITAAQVPVDAHEPLVMKPMEKPNTQTQAPDECYDPPIIGEQPSAEMQPETKKTQNFNSSFMPAWAGEFLATRCCGSLQSGYTTPPSYHSFICGSLYGNNRFNSQQVYFSRCCETGNRYYGGGGGGILAGSSYCKELLNKYRNPPANLEKVEKDGNNNEKLAPVAAPNSSQVNPANTTTEANANSNKKDDEPGCCKNYCCFACCCTYDSWMIWVILLIPILMLLYMIWWKGCGTVVLKLKDITDWPNFPYNFVWDLINVTKQMKLFLGSLGYFAYFIMTSLCYSCCKTCALPKDTKGWCSCKEVKLLIHLVYGLVLCIFLHLTVWNAWPNDQRKYGANQKENHILDCFELCFWFSCVLFFLGVIVFVIYSLERRKIRKRIARESQSEESPVDNLPQQQQQTTTTKSVADKNNNDMTTTRGNVPTQALLHSMCADHVRPIFQQPRKTYSQYGFCQERFQLKRDMESQCRPWNNKVNETFYC